MLKALLFDLDGTLADTDPVHYETWRDVLQEYGLEINPSFYKQRFSGRLNPEIVKDLLPHLSIEEGAALSDRKEAEFRRRSSNLKPLSGLTNILRWMEEQGLKRAVVTNAPVENARFTLKALNLEAAFPIVILADELPRGKPDPLPYQIALQQLGISAAEAIAFEDSPSGIRAAVAAGIPTIGIATTQTIEELYRLGATLAVPNFADALLLQQLQMLSLTH